MLTFITRLVGSVHGRSGALADGASPPRPVSGVPLRSPRRIIDLRVGDPFGMSGPDALRVPRPDGADDDALPSPGSSGRRPRSHPAPRRAGHPRGRGVPVGAARLRDTGSRPRGWPATRLKRRCPSDGVLDGHRWTAPRSEHVAAVRSRSGSRQLYGLTLSRGGRDPPEHATVEFSGTGPQGAAECGAAGIGMGAWTARDGASMVAVAAGICSSQA